MYSKSTASRVEQRCLAGRLLAPLPSEVPRLFSDSKYLARLSGPHQVQVSITRVGGFAQSALLTRSFRSLTPLPDSLSCLAPHFWLRVVAATLSTVVLVKRQGLFVGVPARSVGVPKNCVSHPFQPLAHIVIVSDRLGLPWRV